MKKQTKNKLVVKKVKDTVSISWSIHKCIKSSTTTYKGNKNAMCSTEIAYMLVRKEGKKKTHRMFKTLGAALKEVGI